MSDATLPRELEERAACGGGLLSWTFVSLNLAVFFGFCNLAMFFGFYGYLGKIGIDAKWRGFLVGLEPMAAFFLRLAIIPLLHVGNAYRVLIVSLGLIMAALCGYNFAITVPALAALRILHGAGFVLLVSSGTVLLVASIPKGRSAQAFAVMSVAWLVPYAVMPALFGVLSRWIPNEAHIYALASTLAVPGIVLLVAVRGRIARSPGAGADALKRPGMAESFQALRRPGSLSILGIGFVLFFGNTTVFFFMQDFFTRRGFGSAGAYFTVSTVAVIAARLGTGRLLDKVDRWQAILCVLPVLAVCLGLFGRAPSALAVCVLGGIAGVSLGVLFPLLNSAMYLASPPRLRGANANLVQLVMDAGYFTAPPLAGALLAGGARAGMPFDVCAALVLAGFAALAALAGSGSLRRWCAAEGAER